MVKFVCAALFFGCINLMLMPVLFPIAVGFTLYRISTPAPKSIA